MENIPPYLILSAKSGNIITVISSLLLRKATRDKDKELYIITNLPKKDANAILISNVYRKRWNIETMFREV